MLKKSIVPFALILAASAPGQTTIKAAYKGRFVVGAAVNPQVVSGKDAVSQEIVVKQYNTITAENEMKWERTEPKLGVFSFDRADEFVAFGEKNKMFIHGHCLIWHSQTPRAVFQDDKGQPVTREVLLERMHAHIAKVVGRYKGRVKSWDVVNEALNEDGTLRNSQWKRIIGDDFIAKAFEYAHEADPKATLYYNDYNLEYPAKRDGAVKLITELKAKGVPVSGIGTQAHWHYDTPTLEQVEDAMKAFSKLGVKIAVTEFDIDMLPAAQRNVSAEISNTAAYQEKLNPYKEGMPEEKQQELAKLYNGLFSIFLRYKGIERVTFWGVTDGNTWLNNFPVRGRTNHPLLFDRQGKPKPAFEAVIAAAKKKK